METPETGTLDILYIETYPSGSHGRVLDLLVEHSAHRIDQIRCSREHWRWLAAAAHYEVLEHVCTRLDCPPDLIVMSGPLNASALIAMLPENWRNIPRIVYFHESQWTYPAAPYDPRPYVLAHLDAAFLASEVWFNSRYHLNTFWSCATSAAAPGRVRTLARRLRPQLEERSRVVYPPVQVLSNSRERPRESRVPVLVWNARWEQDKRPDRFVQLLDQLREGGAMFTATILGTGNTDVGRIAKDLKHHAASTSIPGHLSLRSAYETHVRAGDVYVSTADHEFFGVSALESALCGLRPVVPGSLAYPETLPSAYFYVPDDLDDLTKVVAHVLNQTFTLPSHRTDALRFIPERVVPVFDEHCRRVVAAGRS